METAADLIRRKIRAEGPISFASFMEWALYYPSHGYYTSGRRRTGAAGDYYTSPQVHPVFGALLCLQLERLWQIMGRPAQFHVVEPAAGEGRLARDILEYASYLGDEFADALIYVALESAPEALKQPDTAPLTVRYALGSGGPITSRRQLASGPPRGVPSPKAVATRSVPFRGLRGCIISNELLDAFSVHRLVVRDGQLREVYVTLQDDFFEEVLGDLSAPVENLLEVRDNLPPEGSRIEICPSAWVWIVEAAQSLESGFVLTIDYGYGQAGGEDSVASYRQHTAVSPYENVGEQDLTAHVDFGAAMEAGRRAGLRALGLVSQRRFLSGLGLSAFREAAARLRLPQREHDANQMAMLDLVRREGLGSFGVMIQYKGLSAIRPGDLAPRRPLVERLAQGELPVPLLGPERISLLEGRYPHLADGS